MNVYQRLNAAREEFHGLELKKTGENKFAGYKYFELGDFLIPAMRVFSKNGLCAVVSFDADKACMTIRNVEKPDEWITLYSPMGSAALKGCHEVQNIGAVETYQRRYLWVAALEIVEHDALDATTGRDEPRKAAAPAPRPTGSITPTTGAGDGMTAERKEAMQELALTMIDAHTKGEDLKAIALWYDDKNFEDNDERIYCWKLLQANSKLRSTIKANNPSTEKKAA
jgi:hypothetical protein